MTLLNVAIQKHRAKATGASKCGVGWPKFVGRACVDGLTLTNSTMRIIKRLLACGMRMKHITADVSTTLASAGCCLEQRELMSTRTSEEVSRAFQHGTPSSTPAQNSQILERNLRDLSMHTRRVKELLCARKLNLYGMPRVRDRHKTLKTVADAAQRLAIGMNDCTCIFCVVI